MVMLLFVLFGSVYTGGVEAIVWWWRLEIHNKSPRRMLLSVPTTISNCQARGSDGVGAIPSVTGSAC